MVAGAKNPFAGSEMIPSEFAIYFRIEPLSGDDEVIGVPW